MIFTDTSYYVRDLNIPFSLMDKESFDTVYIETYETELLKIVLGQQLYSAFITGLGVDPIDAKWTALRDGKEYEVNVDGTILKVKWMGLKNNLKITPLAPYVFIHWLKYNYTQMTGLGNSSANKENASTVNIRQKAIDGFRSCARLVGDYPYKSNYYQNVLFADDIQEDCLKVLEPSLLNFLYFNRSDYPNWAFMFPDIYNVNMLDL